MNTRSYVPTPRAPRGAVRRLAALAVALGALAALVLGTATPASAHAALIRTDPVGGSVVQTAPQRVLLTFSEGVLLSADSLRVLDPRGADVASDQAQHASGQDSGSTATVTLRPGLGNGTYTVAWKAVSQDSHPVAGAFTFSVGAPSKTTVDLSSEAAVGGGVAGTLYGVARYFAYAGFALLIGSCVFLSVCWPRGALLRPMQRLAAGGWATLVGSTIALLMLRGPYVNGSGLGDAFDLGVMRSMLETRPGAALLSRLLLLAAAAVFLAVLFGSYAKREDPAERADLAWGLGIGGTVVATGIAATWAMAEHASVGIQHQLAMPLDVVHLLSMAVWLGGLITLLTALSTPSTAGAVEPFAVRRFSAIALTAVTTLICTGTYQAWRQVGTWHAFTDTHYGRLLLIKIGLVCTLVCVAWFSRRWTRELGTVPAARAEAKDTARDTAKDTAKAEARTQVKAAAAAKGGPRSGTKGAEKAGAGPAAKSGTKGAANGAPDDLDPGRAAQLRRQQAARSAAEAKKQRDADPGRNRLRRSVLAEVGVAVVLLTVTTMLTGTQPGRAAEEQKGLADAPAASTPGGTDSVDNGVTIPYDTGGQNGKGSAAFSMDPGRTGTPNVVHVILTGPTGVAVEVPEVRLAFTLPAKKLGPIQVPLKRFVAGHWIAQNVQLPLPGTWQISLTVRTSDIDEVTLTRNVQVP
ncbi:copper resistance protein CopC [Streptomyces sp. NPDC051976]|uniref:copper resistance CopC/CopD family protein n=1 Tax=Streptomyces sp. NPDC051976 TaxID=3154947 RepID=UPI00342690BA